MLHLNSAAVTVHFPADHAAKARGKHAYVTRVRVASRDGMPPVPNAHTILAQPRQVALVLRKLLLLLSGIHDPSNVSMRMQIIHMYVRLYDFVSNISAHNRTVSKLM